MLNEIYFDYGESENQEDKFTPYHTRFDCYIERNAQCYRFNYQCNTKYMQPTLESVMECLVDDALAYFDTLNLVSFADEFGYDYSEQETKDIYNACKETYEALIRIFGEDGISELIEELF